MADDPAAGTETVTESSGDAAIKTAVKEAEPSPAGEKGDPYDYVDPSMLDSPTPTTPSEAVIPSSEPTVTPKIDDSQKVDEISPDLLKRAEEFGLNADVAKALGAGGIEAVASAMDRQLVALGRAGMPASAAPAQTQTAETPPQAAAPTQQQPATFTLPPELLGEDSSVDPIIGKTLQGLQQWAETRDRAKEERLTRIEESLLQRDRQHYVDTFEEIIGTLPEEWHALVGKGDYRAVSPELMDGRRQVLEATTALARAYTETGRQVPELKALVVRALNACFADKREQVTRRKIAAEVKGRQNAMLPTPSHRKGAGLSPEESAVQKVGAMMREKGWAGASAAVVDEGAGRLFS